MPKTFILEDLDPERPNLVYKDESFLAALPDDFGLDTEARLLTLQKSLLEIDKEQHKNGGKATPKLLKSLETVLNEIVSIYFPDMPSELIKKIPSGKKAEIMGWWGENCFPQRMSRLTLVKMGQTA
jgi:hypothetical protein